MRTKIELFKILDNWLQLLFDQKVLQMTVYRNPIQALLSSKYNGTFLLVSNPMFTSKNSSFVTSQNICPVNMLSSSIKKHKNTVLAREGEVF
jgi:hypothetical protein